MTNPFHLTRAADLTDEQISQYWVNPKNLFGSMLRASSPLPMIIRGGRGSGKTHLLRYHSYASQRRGQSKEKLLQCVNEAKYLGIFYRCEGHIASRFSGKRTPTLQWQAIFASYLEIVLGQLLLKTARDFITDVEAPISCPEHVLAAALADLINIPAAESITTLEDFSKLLCRLQREIDEGVNMASFRQAYTPSFSVSPGNLIFGIPRLLSEHVPYLNEIMFALFIDEYEHLYPEMQKHVNTLIRERKNPVSFKIGVRPHGIRTYQTWGGDEELKEGSDYELLDFDATLREQEGQYADFAWELCLRRVKFACGGWPEGWTDENARAMFAATFEASLSPEEIVKSKLKQKAGITPWLKDLKSSLRLHQQILSAYGVSSEDDNQKILNDLAFPGDPLLEKTNTFLFYRAWSSKDSNLLQAATDIRDSARAYKDGDKAKSVVHNKVLSHFREDLRDQMLMDLDLDRQAGSGGLLARYLGLEAWIKMSDGIVRNLITVLKDVYDWAQFRGDSAFEAGGISLKSQAKGIQQASAWFVADANVLEADRGLVESGIKRVATLLRKLRYSLKPPECSLCRFAVQFNSLSERTRRIIKAAETWSLLIREGERRSRNPGEDRIRYRINPLVATDYYLPLSARGDIELNQIECDAIFGTDAEDEYQKVERTRLARCTPPFFVKQDKVNNSKESEVAQNKSSDDELTLF